MDVTDEVYVAELSELSKYVPRGYVTETDMIPPPFRRGPVSITVTFKLTPGQMDRNLRLLGFYWRGGTWVYCGLVHEAELKTPKLDKLGRKTRYFTTDVIKTECKRRFRTTAQWRRHTARSR